MRKNILLVSILFISMHVSAQQTRQQKKAEKKARINNMIKEEEEGVIAYRKSFLFGAKLTSNGYGGFLEMGRANSVKKAILYQLEITELKDPKEYKQNNIDFNTTPFIYGKENFVYPVKLGVQQQILFGNKSNKNGISITGNYGGGLDMALLRPYYLQVQKNSDYIYVKYNSPDSAYFLGAPVSGPTFGKGWNELSVTPGLYAKTSLRFDYGAFNEVISAIEVGIVGEYFTKKIPIMVQNSPKSFFFSAYFSLLFGKRK